MGREGRDATVGILAEALIKIELKSSADKLMCVDTNQVGSHVKLVPSNRNIEQKPNLANNGEILHLWVFATAVEPTYDNFVSLLIAEY